MNQPEVNPNALLVRLDAIGRSLKRSGHALALIGLGSVGAEVERLDAYSDLDFFAIVEDGYKSRYLDNLDWLSSLCPIAYHFRNTRDGHKLLFEDGIFCEFAVFEQPELSTIPFAPGRVIWKQPQIVETICIPTGTGTPHSQNDEKWLVGEALTNLYVGLSRLRRGEKLSAGRLIQHYAVDRVLELVTLIESEKGAQKDPFANERRIEQRFPQIAQNLPHFVQGYERSCESAQAILKFLQRHFEINQAMADAIRRLSVDPE
jgi:lincosamide nucleotidyltransferase B/F